MTQEHWAADTPISFPVPPEQDAPVLVDFDGFGFTSNGIVHNISGADLEEMVTPTFAPQGFTGRDTLEPLGIQHDWTEEQDEDAQVEYLGEGQWFQ